MLSGFTSTSSLMRTEKLNRLIGIFLILGVKSIEVLCLFGVVAVVVNYLVSISFVPAALSLYLEVSCSCS